MNQESLSDWIKRLDGAGLLRRYTDERRVDDLPRLMEDNPQQAVLVERVKDCRFPFLANAYATREMYALALGCDPRKVGIEVAAKMGRRFPARLVDTAPCKEVIVRRGEDVNLSIFPLFAYHPFDGHAFIDDTRLLHLNSLLRTPLQTTV